MIAVFFGNECLDIYAEWTVQSMAKEIIFGVISFAFAFAGTFLLYIYDKKKSEKAIENEKIEENWKNYWKLKKYVIYLQRKNSYQE